MDSETAAHLCAQQRHHRYIVFGKKQRYIEVFQCSGEDMNMVLQGASFHSQAAAAAAAAANISKPPLLSPGMLTPAQATSQSALASLSVAPPITPLTLSIPTASQPPSAALIAQQQAQQAQFIAQQNLYARQQAVAVQQQQQHQHHQEQLYLQQLGYYSSPPPTNPPPQSALSPTTAAAAAMSSLQFAQMPGVYYMPGTRSMIPGIPLGLLPQFNPYGQAPFGAGQAQHGLPPTPNLSPISPTYSTIVGNQPVTTIANNSSVKRSYEHAFRNDTTTASNAVVKRQYTGQQTTNANNVAAANAAAVFYSQFYPPPM